MSFFLYNQCKIAEQISFLRFIYYKLKMNNEYQQAKINLVQCSYMDYSLKWNMLLETVEKSALKLSKLISFSINHSS